MDFNLQIILDYLPALLVGLKVTLLISGGGILLGTILGVFLAVLSLLPNRIAKAVSRVTIEMFLAMPVLVLLIWIYYSLPLLVPGLRLEARFTAVLGLGLSLSAFVAEIVRAGVSGVPRGELEVAYLSGMSRMQAIRHILLPQVLSRSWPPLMGQYITLYKFSTLASVIAVPEVLHQANLIIQKTYRPIEIYSAVAVLFLVTVAPLNLVLRRLERKGQIGGTTQL